MILKLLVPQQELHCFLKMTQTNLIKVLSLRLCKVSAVGSIANTLRTGQEMLALNIQEVIRKKSNLAPGKTFLEHRNTSSECPGPVVSLGQQEKVTPGNTLLPLPQRVEMHFFPQGGIYLHALGELSV